MDIKSTDLVNNTHIFLTRLIRPPPGLKFHINSWFRPSRSSWWWGDTSCRRRCRRRAWRGRGRAPGIGRYQTWAQNHSLNINSSYASVFSASLSSPLREDGTKRYQNHSLNVNFSYASVCLSISVCLSFSLTNLYRVALLFLSLSKIDWPMFTEQLVKVM